MAKVSLAEHMKEQRHPEEGRENSGPFLTISRQFGCQGFSLGLLVLEILNDQPGATPWKIYHKEILETLAGETNYDTHILENQRRKKPSLIVDFFQSLSKDRIPSGYEVRNRITEIIRNLAIKGHAIIIGQGASGATQDLPNGLSVRLEAPEQWRVKQIAFRDGLTTTEAQAKIRQIEREREYLRKIYATRFPRTPPFHMTYDCSVFSLTQIAQNIVHMLHHKGLN
jgi:cytidylate kinase